MNEFEILKAPVVTERSTILKEKFNQYVFKVDPDSTKGQIKDAVQKAFKVEVERVRTANFHGKLRRLAAGRPQGRRPDWKKAIVTLKKGQEIKVEQEAGK
jgi:large subunit ribosomal protein L23